jgi:hypothetical protein
LRRQAQKLRDGASIKGILGGFTAGKFFSSPKAVIGKSGFIGAAVLAGISIEDMMRALRASSAGTTVFE